ncbi:MAG: hypothetical protein V4525_10975 [Pseudomonadota bacterium]
MAIEKGGRYHLNEKGERVLIERTLDAAETQPVELLNDIASEVVTISEQEHEEQL